MEPAAVFRRTRRRRVFRRLQQATKAPTVEPEMSKLWNFLLRWRRGPAPTEIERRDEVLYETYGAKISEASVHGRTIHLSLENGWKMEFDVLPDGQLGRPRWIEPFGDDSPAAIKNVLERLEDISK